MTVSRGGGGDCKGISRQTVVPSTDASKEDMCEATFALMRCQCVSSNTNVIEIQRNGKELLGTRITHFELLHMLSLHDRHGVCCTG